MPFLPFRALGPALGLAVSAAPAAAQAPAPRQPAPALVVLVAVDQMRGDYLARYADQWVGGFQRFYRDGTVFDHALQDHAATETAPGHATMLSGREPVHTGIVFNSRSVQDPAAPVLGLDDPVGASPRRFRGTTLYDWMLAADTASRVLSVSQKDRAAILPVGRARGTVLWFAGGRFTTSRYYTESLPSWVRAFDARGWLERLAGTTWDLLRPDSDYAEPDSMFFENGGRDFTFPHRLPDRPDVIARRIVWYPWMDSLTLALALEGVAQLRLGRRGHADLLSVSLSTTDAVGHAFGPDSREIHDQLLRVDLWLGWFMDSLATLVPRDRTVFVLAGDHGIASLPEYTVLMRRRPAGRISLAGFASARETGFEARFRTGFDFSTQYGLMTADVDALRARGVDVDSLADAIAADVRRVPGVDRVYTPAGLAAASDSERAAHLWRRAIPPDWGWLVCASTREGYIWSRGGLSAEHGGTSPEDTDVPIVFLGAGIPARHVARVARTVDIAPTLARLLGVRPTEPLDGAALPEVVGGGSSRQP